MVEADACTEICSSQHVSCSFFFFFLVSNHTIILLRGNDLHTFNTPPPPPYCKSLVSPTIIYSHRILLFTVHDLCFIFYQAPLFITFSFQLPLSHLLSGSVSLPCFPFCTVSLCSHHKTSSVLHPRLSICATHLCCFTESYWSTHPDCCQVRQTSFALARMHNKPLGHAHRQRTGNTHAPWDSVERCCIQMAFAWWQCCHRAAVCLPACFLCVFGASGPLLLFPGVKWHIFQ